MVPVTSHIVALALETGKAVKLPAPLAELKPLADLLRYSDISAFRKAFKKWTGMQPAQFRSASIRPNDMG